MNQIVTYILNVFWKYGVFLLNPTMSIVNNQGLNAGV